MFTSFLRDTDEVSGEGGTVNTDKEDEEHKGGLASPPAELQIFLVTALCGCWSGRVEVVVGGARASLAAVRVRRQNQALSHTAAKQPGGGETPGCQTDTVARRLCFLGGLFSVSDEL